MYYLLLVLLPPADHFLLSRITCSDYIQTRIDALSHLSVSIMYSRQPFYIIDVIRTGLRP
jgi:hypothetical protein